MAAYLIVHRQQITDSERLKQYAKGVDDTIARYGGRTVVRSDEFVPLEGAWHTGRNRDDSLPERITVVEFPDMAALKTWYNSREYAPLKRIRQEAAVCDVAAVDGRRP
jgi:uncharacterized protein (DUF1330 family)